MIFIAQVFAYGSVLYIVLSMLLPILMPVGLKQKKITRLYLNERKSNVQKDRIKNFKHFISARFVRKLMSASTVARYRKIIDRLYLSINPEDIFLDQIIYSTTGLIITIILYYANPLLGYISAIFIILGWLYPVNELENTIERKNKNISLDFPSFYSMLYYQYSKSVSIYLSDVIKDYLPNANPDMAEELGVMLDNIEYGEEYALKTLKKRVPLHYIIKFCDIMETRLKGYDNIAQMAYLKNELDEFRIKNLEAELERRERKNSVLQMILIICLGIYIVIYYLFTIIESIKLFQ